MAKKAANAAFMKPLTPSAELAKVVGEKALPRTQVVKKMWEYIKKHKLQDPKKKTNIVSDDTLKAIFKGKASITMFEMNKYLKNHLS